MYWIYTQAYKKEIWSGYFIAGYISLPLLLWLFMPSLSFAGTKVIIDNDKSISIGLALRSSFSITEKGAPDNDASSRDFNVDNLSIYLDAEFNEYIKMTLNTERDLDDEVRVMDAIVKFEFHENFNLWLGRMHPPGDRANLSGPFYANVWTSPSIVSRYPGIAFGRDDGILVWGKPSEGMIVYSVGIFNGHNNVVGGSNESDNLLYAARIAVNLLDPELVPGYYVHNTYYGDKNVLSIGAAYQFQQDGIGLSPNAKDDFNAWNVDLLFESSVGTGVLTAEGAYYKYDFDGQVDCGSGEPGSLLCVDGTNMGQQIEGTGYLATLAYLIPHSVGIGRFQPFLRQQKFEREVSQTTHEKMDLGVNYVIDKHNVRISAVYSRLKDDRLVLNNDTVGKFVVGVQLQY